MSEQEALLEAIFAAPADDTPRLVYADWLDEHGEGAQAEFIRSQIALAGHRTPSAEQSRLKKREQAAWRKLKRKWADLFVGLPLKKQYFERGFCLGTDRDKMVFRTEVFAARSAEWWPRLPFRWLYLSSGDASPAGVTESVHLRRLTRLQLHVTGWGREYPMSEDFAVRVFSSEQFDRLDELHIQFVPLTRRVANAVRSAPVLPRLRRLSVGYCALRGSAAMTYPPFPNFNQGDGLGKVGGASKAIGRQLDQLGDRLLVPRPDELTAYHALLEHTRAVGSG